MLLPHHSSVPRQAATPEHLNQNDSGVSPERLVHRNGPVRVEVLHCDRKGLIQCGPPRKRFNTTQMSTLNSPLRFTPILKRALWGGTRLERELGKPAGGVSDAAESWEVCDLPGNVSVVRDGPFAGRTIRDLMKEFAKDLLGRHSHATQFPLLIKFLDASEQLSVQVHPKDPTQMPDGSMRPGKAESWFVVDADPENRMYLGLREGVDRPKLEAAAETGQFAECLHIHEAQRGELFYLQPGTVHALGGGLLIAEIQQPSDITYRFYDWDRTDSEGRPRELHAESAMESTNFDLGPVRPEPSRPYGERPGSATLLKCPHFIIHRHEGPEPLSLPADECMHVLIVLAGTVSQGDFQLQKGETAVIPAARTLRDWTLSSDAFLLDSHLPADWTPPGVTSRRQPDSETELYPIQS